MDSNEGVKPESMTPAVPPPDASSTSASAEEANADGLFTPSNMVMLAMIGFGVVYVFYKFSLEDVGAIVKAALGLSFIIFLHELGHFMAAKWCDVNVRMFSIGFGPAIPGCRFTWGETTYKLAIIPLGGYVEMLGQVDGDESSDGSEDDPRSYRCKTVGQRMFIISAGVIMNAILAIVCFIAVYEGPGKENPVAVIWLMDSGGPSYREGLRTGARFTTFGEYDDPTFADLMSAVINSRDEEQIELTFQRPGGLPIETTVAAVQTEGTKAHRPVIGVSSPRRLQLAARRDSLDGPFAPGTTAAKAGFEYGDVIVGMSDPDDRSKITDLPEDPRHPGLGKRDFFEFERRMHHLAGKEVTLRVRRGGDKNPTMLDIKVAPMFRPDLGIRMQMGPILVVQKNSSAAKHDVRGPDRDKKTEGDLIQSVSVLGADGKTVEFKDNALDPERLPIQLRQWADALDKAQSKNKREVKLKLRRHKDPKEAAGSQYETVELKVPWDVDFRYERVMPLSPSSPIAVPELGIGYQVKTIVAGVTKDSLMKPGDILLNIRYDMVGYDKVVEVDWQKKSLQDTQWASASEFFNYPMTLKKLQFKVKRDQEELEIDIPIRDDKSWPLAHYGWLFAQDMRLVKASNPLEAARLGLRDTYRRMFEVFLNIRGMVTGRISVFNLGGPLTIARGAYIFAGLPWGEFVFFLGLISINLAVVNFLPIPVLDGGHMVFLLYEKIRGQPANEAVRSWATIAGLLAIASLMLFVLYIDVTRWFF